MVTASLYIDLSVEPDLFNGRDRHSLEALDRVPTGALVIIDVGSRQWATNDAARLVHRHSERLNIEIRGTTKADLRAWVEACRAGHLDVVA